MTTLLSVLKLTNTRAALMLLLVTGSPGIAQALTLTVTNAATGEPLANAVVAVSGATPSAPWQEPGTVAQEGRQFVPHLLVIPRGTSVDFPNHDNTQHHVYSFSPAKPFNLELFADRPEAPVLFDKMGVVELGCNIHDNMQAFIIVTDAAQTAITGDDGRVEVSLADTGNLQVWHETMTDNRAMKNVTVGTAGEAAATIELDVNAPAANKNPFSELQKRFNSQ
ncbi:methylamine utilization protein [Marinobacter sp. 1Y8]